MREIDDQNGNPSKDDGDVVVYTPHKKLPPKAEYIDDEGVRVASRPVKSRAVTQEPTRRMPAVRRTNTTGDTKRMPAVKYTDGKRRTAESREPSGRDSAHFRSSAAATEQPVARRVRRKTVGGFDLKRLFQNRKLRIFGGAAAAVLAVLVLVLAFAGRIERDVLPGAATVGFTNDAGMAYAPLFDGTVATLEGENAVCVVSPDKTSVICQRRDGSLLCYNTVQKTSSLISYSAKPVAGIVAVRNSGLFYTDTSNVLHRFSFADNVDVTFKIPSAYAIAKNSLSILFCLENTFYVLPSGETTAIEAGNHTGNPKAVAISDDGHTALWTDWSNNAQNIYLYAAGSRSTLETLVGTTAATSAVFSADGSLMAVTNPDSEAIYLVSGGAVSCAKLGEKLVSEQLYTAFGVLEQDAGEVGGVYAHVRSNTDGSVYYIDRTGDREKLLSKVKAFQLRSGNAAFIAGDGSLYTCSVSGANPSERVHVADEVYSFALARDGKHIYYLKEVNAGLGILYVYRIGDGEPEKIASEVYTAYLPCEDSGSVLFYREPERIGAVDTVVGVMYLYSKDSGAVKLASDCVIGKISSGSESGRIVADSFLYLKYLSVGDDGRVYANCVYYNGKESAALIKDICYMPGKPLKLK